MEDRDGFIWADGALVPWREARSHVLGQTLQHGMGVFEGVRAYRTTEGGSAIFRLQDHTRRLFRSAHILQMGMPYSQEQLNAAHLQVMRANQLAECYFRPVVYLGGERPGVSARGNRVHVAIAAWSWDAYLGPEARARGIAVKVSSFTRHQVNSVMCKAKACGNYLNSMLANSEATQLGFDDAVLLDSHGCVMEGSTSNLFIVRDGALATPDLTSVLEGVTRASILALAQDRNIAVEQRCITRDELYIADEVFFTGTASEVTPVVAVDGRIVGGGVPGAVTRQLQQDYFAACNGGHARSAGWLTRV